MNYYTVVTQHCFNVHVELFGLNITYIDRIDVVITICSKHIKFLKLKFTMTFSDKWAFQTYNTIIEI